MKTTSIRFFEQCDEDRFHMPPSDRQQLEQLLDSLETAGELAQSWRDRHGPRCGCLYCRHIQGLLWAIEIGESLLKTATPPSIER